MGDDDDVEATFECAVGGKNCPYGSLGVAPGCRCLFMCISEGAAGEADAGIWEIFW